MTGDDNRGQVHRAELVDLLEQIWALPARRPPHESRWRPRRLVRRTLSACWRAIAWSV